MLDIQEIRDNPQQIKQNLKHRDFDVSPVDDVLDLDKDWREKKKKGDITVTKSGNKQ
jgi:seryl-tRNA synthetase